MDQKYKAVISAQRMLIGELMKTNQCKVIIDYWLEEIEERNFDLQQAQALEAIEHNKQLIEIFGLDFIKEL